MLSKLFRGKLAVVIGFWLVVVMVLHSSLVCLADMPDESDLDDLPVAAAVNVNNENTEIDIIDEAAAGSQNTEATEGAQENAVQNMQTENEAENNIASQEFGLTAKGAVLMEASTGTVLYELSADEKLSPASITKIMTLILIFDAVKSGKIAMQDEVVTSAYARSMGGSQVFLEEGEIQTVETLIKCIVVASGNDASVAMAEYIAGSEGEFVNMMNERAKGLGMNQTHFEDCCGLTEDPSHLTSAKDVAIMSRELITKYPQIKEYSTIWMENITHVTSKGSSEFGLANTNKLLKMATNFTTTGLKTGSTSAAKYCVSATAYKDGVEMIAVILGAADYKVRFSEAEKLLNFGFSKCRVYKDSDKEREPLSELAVENGKKDFVPLIYDGDFNYVDINGADLSMVEKRIELEESIKAPVEQGQIVGHIVYILNGSEIGSVNILTAKPVEEAGLKDCIMKIFEEWRL